VSLHEEKSLHHRGTEDTEKAEEKREGEKRQEQRSDLVSYLSLGFVFSVSSVSLW
jgi:hypothetical protein